MLDAPLLASFLVLGLAGSLHCAGMCGPFALALGGAGRGAARSRLVAYVLGKCIAYGVLAAFVAGGMGVLAAGALEDQERALALTRSVLAWTASGVMVLAGAHGVGLRWRGTGRLTAAMHVPFAALLGAARTLPPLASALTLGLINGCLPCGLSWAAIVLAASHGGAMILVGPALFGLATAPALLGIALGGTLLPVARGVRLRRAAALGLIAFGVFTAARGGFGLGAGAKPLLPCCAESGEDAADRSTAR